MIELANLLVLLLILFLLLGSVLRSDRLLSALFLIGLTQIGSIYPFLGKVRIELVAGVLLLIAIPLKGNGFARLSAGGNRAARYFYLFVLVVLLSMPLAVSPADSWHWIVYYFKRCFILFLGAVVLLDEERKIESLVRVYLAGIFWLAFSSGYNYISGIDILIVDGVQRVSGATGLLSNPNGMANTLVGALPLAYYMIFHYWRKSVMAWLMIAVCGVSLAAIFMSGSRGGFIGLVAAMGAAVLLAKKRSRAFIAIFIVLLVSLTIAGDELIGRYATILEGTASGNSANSRMVGLEHGLAMMIRRPLFGVGIGCYPVARGMWFGWNFWAHNTYGQLMGELGLAGTLAWGLMVFYTLLGARRVRRALEPGEGEPGGFAYYLCLAIEVSVYSRLVLGMTTHSLHVYFWYLNAGLVVCLERLLDQQRLGLKGEDG